MAQEPLVQYTRIPRVRRGYGLIGLLAVGMAGLTVGLLWQASLYPAIPLGVSAGGLKIGGLPPAEARGQLEQLAARQLQATWELVAGSTRREVRLADLDASFDVERAVAAATELGRGDSFWERTRNRWRIYRDGESVAFSAAVPEKRLTALLEEIGGEVKREPQDATLTVKGGSFRVNPHRSGRRLDLEGARRALAAGLESESGTVIRLPLEEVTPRLTAQELERVDTLLATFSTRYNSGKRARSHNLALSAARVDGVVLKPGETFSYNEVVGRRSQKAGYRTAPVFVNGELSEGIGGGVCQVSTTLYNAALLAGLEIVARRPHSRPVDYVRAGRDATVDYGSIDLKFQANTQDPIYIATSAAGGRMVVNVYGSRRDRQEVRIESARKGGKYYTYRVYLDNGKAARRELVSSDAYRAPTPATRTARKPVPKPKPKQPAREAQPEQPAQETPPPTPPEPAESAVVSAPEAGAEETPPGG